MKALLFAAILATGCGKLGETAQDRYNREAQVLANLQAEYDRLDTASNAAFENMQANGRLAIEFRALGQQKDADDCSQAEAGCRANVAAYRAKLQSLRPSLTAQEQRVAAAKAELDL